MKDEIVFRVAGEGGGYTITRFKSEGLWRFAVSSRDVFSEPNERAIKSYQTLREALGQINSGWPQLRAQVVHATIASEVYELALLRLGPSAAALEQWSAAREGGGLTADSDD